MTVKRVRLDLLTISGYWHYITRHTRVRWSDKYIQQGKKETQKQRQPIEAGHVFWLDWPIFLFLISISVQLKRFYCILLMTAASRLRSKIFLFSRCCLSTERFLIENSVCLISLQCFDKTEKQPGNNHNVIPTGCTCILDSFAFAFVIMFISCQSSSPNQISRSQKEEKERKGKKRNENVEHKIGGRPENHNLILAFFCYTNQ